MAKIDQAKLAKDYGYALAFMKSDGSLYKLFQQAVKQNWDSAKWAAQLQASSWWKTHSAAYRQAQAIKYTDPAEYKSRVAQAYAQVQDSAAAIGAHLSTAQISTLATHFSDLGWSDAQLKNALSAYVGTNNSGLYTGAAGDAVAQLKQTAWRNGVKYSDATYQTMAKSIASGDSSVDDYKTKMRSYAAGLAPGLSDQLKGGADLYDLASPYINAMATTFEVSPTDVDLFNPTIRGALNFKDAEGKLGTQSLGDFENGLRHDQRYLGTQHAQDSFMSTAHSVLHTFGFAS